MNGYLDSSDLDVSNPSESGRLVCQKIDDLKGELSQKSNEISSLQASLNALERSVVGGEGDVYPSGRLRDTHYPERRRLETQHFALRAWRAVGGIDQRYIFVDYPLIVRNVIL